MMTEEAIATNGRLPAPSQRFREIQGGLALRGIIEERIAELEALERQTELTLYALRVSIAEMKQALVRADTPFTDEERPAPPTPI